MATQSELKWTTVDVSKLDGELQTAYVGMKALYRQYAAAKAEFESAMQAAYGDKLPADKELKFGYNFGKLSIAVGPARERKATRAQETASLGEWLEAQAQGGLRS